ncbi:3-oxoadipate enol-lactonase 2 [Microbulbifer aggregans]|uniref:3-oxoadipate enol-lactonase 2 n=1 Tax=Microbulbifer aggregans TaxID=1769779 RepID=A0A1C9W997_9GAMM|nr:alpha/beta fold hydrolase [Microbulbifer aggregans]AOS97695.1 3-oxoadipate enol-lactonase 2 [Microbulbifer aggregans]
MATIKREGIHLHYTVTGSGPALVLLHSFLASSAMWETQIPALSERYTVIAVDLRGHGDSGPIQRDITIYDLLDDVVAILDAEGIERAAWAGLSIGGMITLRAALKVPERVSGVLLLDTHAGAERPLKKLRYHAMVTAARLFGIRPLLPQVLKLMFGEHTLAHNKPLVDEWRDRIAAVPFSTIQRGVSALTRREDLSPQLGNINQPALVIVGEEDQALPPAYSREIARLLPQATLIEVPRSGHLSALEQPDAVTGAMLNFLGKLEPAAQRKVEET